MKWIKTSSWHIVEIEPEGDAAGKTMCGRTIPSGATLSKDFVGNEKTCESCLRIATSEDAD